MKNVLVTGAAGFIGSHLSKALCDKGYIVLGIDNFATGRLTNIVELQKNRNFKFIKADIRDSAMINKLLKGINVVFHQAALGSVPRSVKDPLTTHDVNVNGFLNVLNACVNCDVQKLIYAASSSTYGDSVAMPKLENQIGAPLSPYAVTKYVNELYAGVFYKTYGISTIGLRYFNVFGPHQDPNGAYAAVIPTFVKQFMNHEPITINGDGSYSRDFTYVDNVVQANILAMESTNPSAWNQVYNVACAEQTKIGDLAFLLRDKLSSYDAEIAKVPIRYQSVREGDVPHSLASIEKAKSLLGYQPEFKVDAGLDRSIDWYWENL